MKNVGQKLIRKILIISLLAGLAFFSGCADTKVQTVDDEAEANQIINVLREYGLRATKLETGDGNNKKYDILVSGGDEEYGAAIQLMDEHCLPQIKPPIIESEGLVPSGQVEKARDLQRMRINIENQLRNLPGVTCVIVNLGKSDEKQLTLDPEPASATVSIKYKTPQKPLDTRRIARMVAGGITGLEADRVFVTLTRKPLRPLPDLNTNRNTMRILLVGGIGFGTILAFFSIVFVMRKKRTKPELQVVNESMPEMLPGESNSDLFADVFMENNNPDDEIDGAGK
jgi:type III secretory pathway lipoprotein EscJ